MLKFNVRKVSLKQGKYDCWPELCTTTLPESPGHCGPVSAVLLKSFVLLVVCLCAPSFWISLGIAAGQQHLEFLKKQIHCEKKVSDFPVLIRDVTNQTLPDILFSARESLVSDIPAGDGTANLFLQRSSITPTLIIHISLSCFCKLFLSVFPFSHSLYKLTYGNSQKVLWLLSGRGKGERRRPGAKSGEYLEKSRRLGCVQAVRVRLKLKHRIRIRKQ
jgi:hypothetical protein